VESLDVQLVDDRVFVPKRIDGRFKRRLRHAANSWRNNRRDAIVRFLTRSGGLQTAVGGDLEIARP
jgi:hypothetical protein